MNSERKIDEIYRDLRSHAPPEDVAERLLTELERYFHEGILSHPLVVCSAVNIERCAEINRLFRQKKKQARRASLDRNWHEYIFLHERSYRFDAMYRCMSRGLLKDGLIYNETIRDVWLDSENIRQSPGRWRRAWESANILPTEWVALAATPNMVTVFRGGRGSNAWRGLSWTLNQEKARWFATRFSERGNLFSGVVAKAQIKAHLRDRNEDEVIVFPEFVQNVTAAPIEPP